MEECQHVVPGLHRQLHVDRRHLVVAVVLVTQVHMLDGDERRLGEGKAVHARRLLG
jgi:hypothetical protein